MTVIAEINEHYPLGTVCGEFDRHGLPFTLTRPFRYVDKDFIVDVPIGFSTDFNSVPRLFWNLFAATDYVPAGVVHDFLYRYPGLLSRREVDGIHNRIMAIEGAPWWLRRAARIGLLAGGWKPWGKYRAAEKVKAVVGPKDAA